MIAIDIHKILSAASGEMLLQVNTEIPSGQLLTLYGKSGAGKTTLLRILAGLTPVDKGRIIVNGITWLDTDKNINLPPQQRNIGFVFQDYALFPNMTVRQNLNFALPKGEDPHLIQQLIDITELGDLQHNKPPTLSGGQQQRVALARTLIQRPQMLLLDEPFSALDNEIRQKLQAYLLDVHQTNDLTTFLVSHDETEIQKMSSTILVLEAGKVVRQGKVGELFARRRVVLVGRVLGKGASPVEGAEGTKGVPTMAEKGDEGFTRISVEIGENLVDVFVEDVRGKEIRVGDRIELDSELRVI